MFTTRHLSPAVTGRCDATFADRATAWLHKQHYEFIATEAGTANAEFETWNRTLKRLGIDSMMCSLRPHQVPFRIAKSFFVAGNRTQADPEQVAEAVRTYADESLAVGLRFGRLSQGNTRLVAFVAADTLSAEQIAGLLDRWAAAASALQHIGRSPGQTYGEAVVGLYALGLGGFRIQQPVEIYPVLVVNDDARFDILSAALLAESTRERYQRRDTLKRCLLPSAPVYLQAILACPPRGAVAFDRQARETRRAWRAYKKPKLAERVFTGPQLTTLLG
jgi:hypothetical protein